MVIVNKMKMMRRFLSNLALMAVAALGAVSCNDANVEDLTPANVGDALVIRAVPVTPPQSKVNFTEKGEAGMELDWEVDDTFSLFESESTDFVGDFKCRSVADDGVANFVAVDESLTLSAGVEYRAMYPKNNTETFDNGMDYMKAAVNKLQEQDFTDINSLDDYAILMGVFTSNENGGTTENISFVHNTAVMTFTFKSEQTPSYLIFEDGDEAGMSYRVNFDSETFVADAESGLYTSHIMINPNDGSKRTLRFTLYDSNDEAYMERSVESSVEYKAGQRYLAPISDLPALGEATNPYKISSEEDLKALAAKIYNNDFCTGEHYVLTQDITLTNWDTTIGYYKDTITYYFEGIFDGQGFNIEVENDNKKPIFAYIKDAEIRNLSTSGSITSNCGIVDYSYSSSIINCHSSANINTSNNEYIGGIVGRAIPKTVIAGCYFDGSIKYSYQYGNKKIGGIVGSCEESYLYGNYCSAEIEDGNKSVVNYISNSTYSDCYYDSDVMGTTDDIATPKSSDEMKGDMIIRLLNNGLVRSGKQASAFKKSDDGGYPVIDYGVTPTQMETFEGTGTSDDPYIITTAADLRLLSSRVNTDKVNFAGICFKLGDNIDLGGIDSNGDGVKANEFTAIGSLALTFGGSFDGANHTISGLYISTGYRKGLFGSVSEGFSVKNLTVKGKVYGSSIIAGIVGDPNGTITMDNCINYVDVTSTSNGVAGVVAKVIDASRITNCKNYGTIVSSTEQNSMGFGGVIGTANSNDVIISNCSNYGDVKVENSESVGGILGTTDNTLTIENCNNSGEITAKGYVGGVLGNCDNTSLVNCHNTGIVTGCSSEGLFVGGVAARCLNATECSNSANISGLKGYVGGIAGYCYSSIYRCYNTGDIEGNQTYVGGVTGNCSNDIYDCYNTGSVTIIDTTNGLRGGVAGLSSKAYNCYNIGYVQYDDDNSDVNSVIGYSGDSATNCYYLDSTTYDKYSTPKSSAEMTNGSFAASLGENWKEDTNNINNGYPILKWQE